MAIVQAILALLTALPEIIRLMHEMEKQNRERSDDQKLKEDVKEIREAFRTRDASRLKRVFNNEE